MLFLFTLKHSAFWCACRDIFARAIFPLRLTCGNKAWFSH